MRYFITLSFDGTAFHGWQIQPNGSSVQGELQRALSLLLRQSIEVVGAGRTDAGVHARIMVAHFDYDNGREGTINFCEQLAYKLNRILPVSVAISKIEPVEGNMHARFSARRRTYRYYVHTKKDPFIRDYSLEVGFPLDFDLMNKAAEVLLDYVDFGAFCKSHTDVKTTLCKVDTAVWRSLSPYRWYFEISADRFLRNMVRAIVGTLFEVGRHKMTIEDFRRVVEGGCRSDAGESVPPHGLFLENIEY